MAHNWQPYPGNEAGVLQCASCGVCLSFPNPNLSLAQYSYPPKLPGDAGSKPTEHEPPCTQ